MILKGLIDEDFINYKKPSMVLEFPYCTFKCDKECGSQVCQNSSLAAAPNIEVNPVDIATRYFNNPITEAIICQGLEPFDSIDDLFHFIYTIREFSNIHDDIVIYTGYTKEELENFNITSLPFINIEKCKNNTNEIKLSNETVLTKLKKYDNIIVKYGRFIPNQQYHYDEILGVNLASPNQYAERLS